MLYKTPPEELKKDPPRAPKRIHGVLPVLAAILLCGALGLGGAWLMIKLIGDDRMLHCMASGRRNCGLIPY
ncbi:MAG TPA: hypothetical protein VKS78_04455 [Roseiarcus sp.]|nr:hypothetical protein [Roseiarcus sp.]